MNDLSHTSIKLTREELYRQVWSKPTTTLAKELGISDVAIGKLCRKLNVPKPPPGYWRRVEVGSVLKPPPLPPIRSGLCPFVEIYPNPSRNSDASQDPEVLDITLSESLPESRIRVADHLRSPHALVREAKETLQGAGVDDYGMLWQRSALDLRVSRKMLARALRIMEALIKALEARGHKVEVPKTGWQKRACAVIGEEAVGMRLWERATRSERELTIEERRKPPHAIYDRYVYNPSGRLTFTLDAVWAYGVKKNWTETEEEPLEEKLNEVVVGIVTAAHVARKNQQKRDEEERLRQEELLRRQEGERRSQEEEARRKALEVQSELWVKSRNLRAFLQACESLIAERSGEIDPDSAEALWLRWAYSHADRLDPLKNDYLDLVAQKDATAYPR